ncbi:MAG: hypothetical protein ACJ8AT_15555 [Hyalangium sp.]
MEKMLECNPNRISGGGRRNDGTFKLIHDVRCNIRQKTGRSLQSAAGLLD